MNIDENSSVDLLTITPDWFYQKLGWDKISRLMNIITWQGLVKKGEEITIAEHAISICVAIPCSESMTGPLFANAFLANIAHYLVQSKIYESLYVNGDSIMQVTDEVDEGGNKKENPISFSFYKYVNGISLVYFGFPNYSSMGGGIGLSKTQIDDFLKFAEALAISILHTTFVNGLFGSISK